MKRLLGIFLFPLLLAVSAYAQQPRTFTLKASGANTATVVGTARTIVAYDHIVVTWDIAAADDGNANETYDMYITCGDGVATWDIIHFPQITADDTYTYVARVSGVLLPQNVTTAGPGVAAVETATMKTDTAGADQGVRSLTAGMVRHGPCGDRINYELVISGTTPSITSSLTVTLK